MMVVSHRVVWCLFCAFSIYVRQSESTVAKRCFLYPEGIDYDLQNDLDTHVTINCVFKEQSFTKIQDEKHKCIVGVKHYNHSGEEDADCLVQYSSDAEYTTLVFRSNGDESSVYLRDSSRNEDYLNRPINRIRVQSAKDVNVAFDCPESCYEFENALIHKSYSGLRGINKPLRIYGKLKRPEEAANSKLEIRYIEEQEEMYQPNTLNFTSDDTNWNYIEVNPSFSNKSEIKGDSFTMQYNISGTLLTESIQQSDLSLKTQELYLRFTNSHNVRWAVPCRPTSTNSTGVSSRWLVVVSAGCSATLLLLLSICNCVCIRRQHLRLKEEAGPSTEAVPTRMSADEDSDNLVDHEYEYIDPVALQRQLALFRSRSEQNVSAGKGPLGDDSRRWSHTSVNSLYGYTQPRF